MSFLKRIRVMWYAASQQWHEKTCANCEAKWMAIGKSRPELVTVCDACQAEEIDRFMRHTEYEYQRQMRGVR
jgi:hypothetical protein